MFYNLVIQRRIVRYICAKEKNDLALIRNLNRIAFMNTQSQKVSMLEKVGYSLGDCSANLVFQMMMIYQTNFIRMFLVLKVLLQEQ